MRQVTNSDGYGMYWGYMPGRKRPVLALRYEGKIRVLAYFNDQSELERFDRCMRIVAKQGIEFAEVEE